MRIMFLGTGSSDPDADRLNLSLLIEQGDCLILVDCSSSPAQNILRAGYSLDRLTDVILTHPHVDHIYGFPSLVHSLWLHKGVTEGKRLQIHGLTETLDVAKRLLDIFSLSERKGAVKTSWKTLDSAQTGGVFLIIDGYHLFTFLVNHGSMPTIGIGIVSPSGDKILYSCDSRADESISRKLDERVVALIQDCGGKLSSTAGHAGAYEVHHLVRGTAIKSLFLVHLPPTSREEKEKIHCIIKDGFGGLITFPNDGEEIRF